MKGRFTIFFRLNILLAVAAIGSAGLVNSALAQRQFDFARYCDSTEMAEAIRHLLPRGTPKSVVEQRLVKEGGAIVQPDEPSRGKPNYFRYFRKALCSPEDTKWWVNVTYDRNDTVRQISGSGLTAVFPHTPPQDRADAGIFDFDDYEDSGELMETLRALFPLDTSRADVERVLVKWNLSQVWERKDEPRAVVYRHSGRFSETNDGKVQSRDRVWNIEVTYIDGKLTQLKLDGSPVVTGFKHSREYWLKHKKQGN